MPGVAIELLLVLLLFCHAAWGQELITEIYKYKYTEEEKGKMGETQDKNQWRNGMLDVVEAEQSQL